MPAINEAKNYKVTIVVNRRVGLRTYYTGDERYRTKHPTQNERYYRAMVIREVIAHIHGMLGNFEASTVSLNGDIIILDRDDVESGVVAVIKEVRAQ